MKFSPSGLGSGNWEIDGAFYPINPPISMVVAIFKMMKRKSGALDRTLHHPQNRRIFILC